MPFRGRRWCPDLGPSGTQSHHAGSPRKIERLCPDIPDDEDLVRIERRDSSLAVLGDTVSTRTGASRIGYRSRYRRVVRIWAWSVSQSVSQSVRERVNCECDECPVGWSTHHPDPSHGTVVPHRGAQATKSHSVAWISCQSVRQSRLFANYYTVRHSEYIPCPCTCNLRPGSPYQPARPALMCYEYAAPWLGHVWTVLP